ncbi:thiazole biosynthesis protein ThiJ [Planctomycetales bacterium]|nr:thiazole biosynthesis protein ThiJ [Planctomycetales bacterium]
MPTIIVPLANGFEEIEAITSIDVLCRAGFDVVTVGLAATPKVCVTGSHGIVVTPDKSFGEVDKFTPDALVLPGGMPGSKNLGDHIGLKKLAERVAESGGLLAAICAAPAWTLATWGLLAGRQATCFPGCESMFPKDVQHSNVAVVIDDAEKNRVITAKGPGAALDFSLAIVETFAGQKVAADLKTQLQYTEHI